MIRLGFIGGGFFSQVTHLPCYSKLPECRLAAACDIRPGIRDYLSEKFRIPYIYARPEELLEKTNVDAVVISLPRPCTGPAVEMALDAGKHVFSEKPMAMTYQQAKKLAEQSRKTGMTYSIGFMKRHDDGVAEYKSEIQKLLQSGNLGELQHVMLENFTTDYAVPIPEHYREKRSENASLPEWPSFPEYLPKNFYNDYTATINVTSHDFNLVRYIFGNDLQPLYFNVMAGKSQIALLRGKHCDFSLNFGKSTCGQWHQVISSYFQNGYIRLKLPSPLDMGKSAAIETAKQGQTHYWRPDPDESRWCFMNQAREFLDAVSLQNEVKNTGEDALLDMALINTLWSSFIHNTK